MCFTVPCADIRGRLLLLGSRRVGSAGVAGHDVRLRPLPGRHCVPRLRTAGGGTPGITVGIRRDMRLLSFLNEVF